MLPGEDSPAASLRKSKKVESDEDKCSVSGCKETAVRSISAKKVEKVFSEVKGSKRAHLCKKHYKEYKKETKPDREAERWGWG